MWEVNFISGPGHRFFSNGNNIIQRQHVAILKILYMTPGKFQISGGVI